MRLTNIQIRNYKSFEDSGRIELAPGINVVVGRNNAGKSSLLEAMTCRFDSRPHRSIRSVPQRDSPVNSWSRIDFALNLSGDELRKALLAAGGRFRLPTEADYRSDERRAFEQLNNLFQRRLSLRYEYRTEGGVPALQVAGADYVDYRLTAEHQRSLFEVKPDRTGFSFQGFGNPDAPGDEMGFKIGEYLRRRIFAFRAERYSVGRSEFGVRTELVPNASNLPEVLNTLQGNPKRFLRFNEYVREIFPTIQNVSVLPRGGHLEIAVWTTDPALERDDLAVALDECGTGVGQVLAILYATITSPGDQVIIIDEPNTFLHPGAARKLMEILRQFPEQQFIVATHSAEVISAAKPDRILLLKWDDGRSAITPIDFLDTEAMRSTLREVGASLGDVFGADRVVWVEGTTEAECFPMILDRVLRLPLVGTAIIAIRDTGTLESKRADANAIWGIYERLSQGAALLPPSIAFSFDREGRTLREMEDLARRSAGRVRFLPRRMYENYLLAPEGITALLNNMGAFENAPCAVERVIQWLREHHGKFLSVNHRELALGSDEWFRHVDGAKLLQGLVQDLSEAREEYRKTRDSVWITRWLIENRPQTLAELVEYLRALVTEQKAE